MRGRLDNWRAVEAFLFVHELSLRLSTMVNATCM